MNLTQLKLAIKRAELLGVIPETEIKVRSSHGNCTTLNDIKIVCDSSFPRCLELIIGLIPNEKEIKG